MVDLMPFVERTEHKLSSTLYMLDQGSKLTLLNSLITSMLIYPMCTLKFPPKLIEHLDKIRRRCLWRKQSDQGEIVNSLAAWDLVCRPKTHGGLGIINIKTQNIALLLKFLHNFYNRKDLPWVNLIWATYYNNKVPHATEPCGSFWWRDVMNLSDIYRGISSVHIGDGTTALLEGFMERTHNPR